MTRTDGTYSNTYASNFNPLGQTIAFSTMLASTAAFIALGSSPWLGRKMDSYLVKNGIRQKWEHVPGNTEGNPVYETHKAMNTINPDYKNLFESMHRETKISVVTKTSRYNERLKGKDYQPDFLRKVVNESYDSKGINLERRILSLEGRHDQMVALRSLHDRKVATRARQAGPTIPIQQSARQNVLDKFMDVMNEVTSAHSYNKTIDHSIDLVDLIQRELPQGSTDTEKIVDEVTNRLFGHLDNIKTKMYDITQAMGDIPIMRIGFDLANRPEQAEIEHVKVMSHRADVDLTKIPLKDAMKVIDEHLVPHGVNVSKWTRETLDVLSRNLKPSPGGYKTPFVALLDKRIRDPATRFKVFNEHFVDNKDMRNLLGSWDRKFERNGKATTRQEEIDLLIDNLKHGTRLHENEAFVRDADNTTQTLINKTEKAQAALKRASDAQSELVKVYDELRETFLSMNNGRFSNNRNAQSQIGRIIGQINVVQEEIRRHITLSNTSVRQKIIALSNTLHGEVVSSRGRPARLPDALDETVKAIASPALDTMPEDTTKHIIEELPLRDVSIMATSTPVEQTMKLAKPMAVQVEERTSKINDRLHLYEESLKQQLTEHKLIKAKDIAQFKASFKDFVNIEKSPIAHLGYHAKIENTIENVIRDAAHYIGANTSDNVKDHLMKFMLPTDTPASAKFRRTETLTREGQILAEVLFKDHTRRLALDPTQWAIRTGFTGKTGMTEDIVRIVEALEAKGVSRSAIRVARQGSDLVVHTGVQEIRVPIHVGAVTLVGSQTMITAGMEKTDGMRINQLGIDTVHNNYISEVVEMIQTSASEAFSGKATESRFTAAEVDRIRNDKRNQLKGKYGTAYGVRSRKIAINEANSVPQMMSFLLETQDHRIGRSYDTMNRQYFEKQILLEQTKLNSLRDGVYGNAGDKARMTLVQHEIQQRISNLKNRQRQMSAVPFDKDIILERANRDVDAIYNYSTGVTLDSNMIASLTHGSIGYNFFGVNQLKALKGISTHWTNDSAYFNRAKGVHGWMNVMSTKEGLRQPNAASINAANDRFTDLRNVRYRLASDMEVDRIGGNYHNLIHMPYSEVHGRMVMVNMPKDQIIVRRSFAEHWMGMKARTAHVAIGTELGRKLEAHVAHIADKLDVLGSADETAKTMNSLLYSGREIKADDLLKTSYGSDILNSINYLINDNVGELDDNLKNLYFGKARDAKKNKIQLHSIVMKDGHLQVHYNYFEGISSLSKVNHELSGKSLIMVVDDAKANAYLASRMASPSATSEEIRKIEDRIKESKLRYDVIGSNDLNKVDAGAKVFNTVLDDVKDYVLDALDKKQITDQRTLRNHTEYIMREFVSAVLLPEQKLGRQSDKRMLLNGKSQKVVEPEGSLWKLLTADWSDEELTKILKNKSGDNAWITDIFNSKTMEFGDGKLEAIAEAMKEPLKKVLGENATPAERQQFVKGLFARAIPKIADGMHPLVATIGFRQMAVSTYDLFRTASGKSRPRGGFIDGVQYDPWTHQYLAMKGLDTRVHNLSAQMATASDSVNQYMYAWHTMMGSNPTRYLDPKFLGRIGELKYSGVMTTKQLQEMKSASQIIADKNSQFKWLTGGIRSKKSDVFEMDDIIDKLIAHDTQGEAEDKGGTFDKEHLEMWRKEIEEAQVEHVVIDHKKSIRETFRDISELSSLMTHDDMINYHKFLQTHNGVEASAHIRLPHGFDTTRTMSIIGFVDGVPDNTSTDAMKLFKRMEGNNGMPLYALNSVLQAERKYTMKSYAYQQWLKQNEGRVDTTANSELKDELANDLTNYWYTLNKASQNVIKGQMKQRQPHSLQMVGKSSMSLDLSKITDHRTVLDNIFMNVGPREDTAVLTPRPGIMAIDIKTFEEMMGRYGGLEHQDVHKLAMHILKGDIMTSGYFSRQPQLYHNSLSVTQLMLFDTEHMLKKGAINELDAGAMRQTAFINRMDAVLKRGDFDSDLYNFVSFMRHSYADEAMESISSYAVEHSLGVKHLDGEGYHVTLKGTGTWVRHHYDVLREAVNAQAMKQAGGLSQSHTKAGADPLYWALNHDTMAAETMSVYDAMHNDFEMHFGREGTELGEFMTKRIMSTSWETVHRKFRAEKRSAAQRIFGLREDDMTKYSDKDIDEYLKKARTFNRHGKIMEDVTKRMELDSDPDITEHEIRAFGIGDLKDVEEDMYRGMHDYLTDLTGNSKHANQLIETMRRDAAQDLRHFSLNRKESEKRLAESFITVKQGTGTIYNYAHGVIQEAALSLHYTPKSRQLSNISMWSWAPQQINISAKHLLPSISTSWMRTVELATGSSGSAANAALKLLTNGDTYLEQFSAGKNILDENKKLSALLDKNIDTVRDKLKGKEDEKLVDELSGFRTMINEHEDSFKSRFDKNKNLAHYKLTDHRNALDMKRKMLTIAGASGLIDNPQQEIDSLKESVAAMDRARAMARGGAEHEVFSGEFKEDVTDFILRMRPTGGLEKFGRSVLTKMISNRTMDFFSGGNTMHQMFNLFTGRDHTMMGQLFNSANEMKDNAHMTSRIQGGRVGDFMDHLVEGFATKMENSKNGAIRDVMQHFNTGDLHGRGAGFMGMAALLGGFIGVIAASPSDRSWLGPSAGTGGKYYDNVNTKDERRYANDENQRTLADGREIRRGHNVPMVKKARIQVPGLPYRYGTYRGFFSAFTGSNNTTYDPRVMALQSERPQKVAYWG